MAGRGPEPDLTGRRLWMWLGLVPLVGVAVPLVAGVRYRHVRWLALGVCWLAVTVVGFVLSGGQRSGSGTGSGGSAGGGLLLLGWVGAAVTSLRIKRSRRGRTSARRAPGSVRRDRWPWVSLLPLGLGSWAPMIAGGRCRVRWWFAAGFGGLCATVAGILLAAAASSQRGTNNTEAAIGSGLLIAAWIWGVAVSFEIRPAYDERRGFPYRRPAWPRPSARSLEWSARYALVAYAVTFAAVVLLGLILGDLVGLHVHVGVGVLIVDAILVLGLVPLARKRGLSLDDLGLRRTLPVRSLWLVIEALVVYITIAAFWALAFIGRSTGHEANVLSQVKHLGTFELVLTVIAISLCAPIVEEIFFRGLLYRSLRNRLPIWQAALLAGMLFGLVHITGYPLITLPIKAVFGVLACLLYERTGSLLPGIALHSFVDASVVDIALTGNDNVVLIVAGSISVVLLLRGGFVAATRKPTGVQDAADLNRALAVAGQE